MDKQEKYPLHSAVLNSDIEKVRELISNHSDLNELDELGQSALHWCVFRGDFEIAQILLSVGANPNVFAQDGVTPRWRANDFGLTEIEALIIKFGGHIDTNEKFDKKSFWIFNILGLGIPLPKQNK